MISPLPISSRLMGPSKSLTLELLVLRSCVTTLHGMVLLPLPQSSMYIIIHLVFLYSYYRTGFCRYSWHAFFYGYGFLPNECDDVESLLYTLVFCLFGNLPWANAPQEKFQQRKTAWLLKSSSSAGKLPSPLSAFAEEINQTHVTESRTPLNYDKYAQLFSEYQEIQ